VTERECFDPIYLADEHDGTVDCPFCPVTVAYANDDIESALADVLAHIERHHPDEDQAPVLTLDHEEGSSRWRIRCSPGTTTLT
jgi:uncharacterized Zn finger protein (UPF0148 family)